MIKLSKLAIFAGLSLGSLLSIAQSNAETNIDLAEAGITYTPANVTFRPEVGFPTKTRSGSLDAHISVRYDIDENGKPNNFNIVRTTGTKAYEPLVLGNMEDWVITPAMQNGEPVAQENQFYDFVYYTTRRSGRELAPTMRVSFQRAYRQLRTLLKEEKYEEFAEFSDLLSQANIANFIETRQLWLLRNAYLNRTDGSIHDKIHSLEKALTGRPRTEKGAVLQDKIRANLFKLYVENAQYFDARNQFYQIQQSDTGAELVTELGPMLDDIESKLVSGEPLSATVKVRENEVVRYVLSRASFSVSATAPVNSSELRCDGFNVKFDYVENAVFTTPRKWGYCELLIESENKAEVTISEV